MTNDAPSGKTSAGVPGALPRQLARTGAKLVIREAWGTERGGAARRRVPRRRQRGDRGAVRHGGANLILLDTTFVPSPALIVAIEAYRDSLLSVVMANHVPLLRRHAMMRLWSKDGALKPAAGEPPERELVAHHLFSCVAQVLAALIAAAER